MPLFAPSGRQSKVATVVHFEPVEGQLVCSMDVDHIMEPKIHRNTNAQIEGFCQEWDRTSLFHARSAGLEHRRRRICYQQRDKATPDEAFIESRWPAFGSRPHRHPLQNLNENSTAYSQSSLSRPGNRTHTPSRSTPSPPCQSFYRSTPYSQSPSLKNKDTRLPSPLTFRMPSLRQSRFKQPPPPPLPPLDHPAFREQVNEFGVLLPFRSNKNGVVRHSHSLPSMEHVTKEMADFQGAGKDDKQQREPSSISMRGKRIIRKAETRGFHSKTSGKSLSVGSRRSSALYSAKQAASLNRDGCWEADVSRAIISLSLRHQSVENTTTRVSTQASDVSIAFPGGACGYNKPSIEQVVKLKSPVSVQGTLAHNLINNRIYNDYCTSVESRYPTVREPKNEERNRIKEMMANGANVGESVTPITTSLDNPATSGKAKETFSGSAVSSLNTALRRSRTASSGRTRATARRQVETTQAQGSSLLLVPPQLCITGPTPETSPISPIRRQHLRSTPTMPPKSILPPVIERSYSSGSTKRKAEEVDVEVDKSFAKETKENRATFAPDPRTHRLSAQSLAHAPSSYHRSKRVRLTNSSEGGRSTVSKPGQRPGSSEGSPSPPSAKNTGSWSSRGSHGPRTGSSYHFTREGPPLAHSASHHSHGHGGSLAPSRRSLSQVSIPISALISPHAPSISHSGTFHMRDPRKPPPIQSTPWSLSFPTQWQPGESRWDMRSWVARGGSPLHAWFFFLGFLLFPLWWVAAFLPIPRTRRVGATDAEKGVILDDPQVEHDAKSWRTRCRVMAIVSLVTYIPFIVLIAIFAPH